MFEYRSRNLCGFCVLKGSWANPENRVAPYISLSARFIFEHYGVSSPKSPGCACIPMLPQNAPSSLRMPEIDTRKITRFFRATVITAQELIFQRICLRGRFSIRDLETGGIQKRCLLSNININMDNVSTVQNSFDIISYDLPSCSWLSCTRYTVYVSLLSNRMELKEIQQRNIKLILNSRRKFCSGSKLVHSRGIQSWHGWLQGIYHWSKMDQITESFESSC